MKYPMKAFLLKGFAGKEEMWEYEVFGYMSDEYGEDMSVWKDNIRYWLMEYEVGGMLELTDAAPDTSGYYPGRLAHKYRLTPEGRSRIETMLGGE